MAVLKRLVVLISFVVLLDVNAFSADFHWFDPLELERIYNSFIALLGGAKLPIGKNGRPSRSKEGLKEKLGFDTIDAKAYMDPRVCWDVQKKGGREAKDLYDCLDIKLDKEGIFFRSLEFSSGKLRKGLKVQLLEGVGKIAWDYGKGLGILALVSPKVRGNNMPIGAALCPFYLQKNSEAVSRFKARIANISINKVFFTDIDASAEVAFEAKYGSAFGEVRILSEPSQIIGSGRELVDRSDSRIVSAFQSVKRTLSDPIEIYSDLDRENVVRFFGLASFIEGRVSARLAFSRGIWINIGVAVDDVSGKFGIIFKNSYIVLSEPECLIVFKIKKTLPLRLSKVSSAQKVP